MNDSPHKVLNYSNFKRLLKSYDSLDQLIFAFIIFQLIGQSIDNSSLMHLKPVPIILMIFKSIYLVDCDKNITIGLLLGLMGDICLMFPTTILFQIGAVFFLTGHVFYISHFMKNFYSSQHSFKFQKMFSVSFTLVIFVVLFANSLILWNYLPNKILFLLYGIVLSSMASSSFYRYKERNVVKYWIGVIGAISFMTSDYIIAYSKFMGIQMQMKGALIMFLYYGGQYLVLKGNSQKKVKAIN